MSGWRQYAQATPGEFTLAKFYAQMSLQFKNQDAKRKASIKLHTLSQKQSSFEDYYTTFQKLLYESGTNHTWSDEDKITRFQQGMNFKTQKATLSITKDTFVDYVREAKVIAERQAAMETRSNGWRGNGNNSRNNNNRNGTPAPAHDQMDWEPAVGAIGARRARWVDESELQRRRESNLCFRCGASDHSVRRCPHLPAIRPGNRRSPNHRVARFAEAAQLESEDEQEEEDQGKE